MPAAAPPPPDLDRAFAALGDPTRRALLERLGEGEASFTELARPFEISAPAVVKHLRVLEAAGLVAREGARARPVYRLAPGALAASRDWLDRFARFWDGALDRLDDYIAGLDAVAEDEATPPDAPAKGPARGEPGKGEKP